VGPKVFKDDPARLLRAVRIAVQLNFRLSEDAVIRIRSGARLVAQVAPERVKDEFLKIMACPAAPESIRMLDGLGLLCKVIPELEEAKGVAQPREHYWDVFNHLVETTGKIEEVLAGSESEDGVTGLVPGYEGLEDHFHELVSDGHTRLTLLKVVALLHDVAKPATKTIESTGRIRFLGHHSAGAEIVEHILRRLRFSGRGVALARLMVQNHLRPTQMSQKGEMPSGKAIYRYYRDVGDAAIDVLYLNMADYLAARGPNLGEEEWRDHTSLIGYILREGLRQKTPETLPKLVDGNDIMERFALPSGRLVGRLLDIVHEAQANQDIMTKEEAYELVRTNLESGGSGA
jgi:poly(A) polymerase